MTLQWLSMDTIPHFLFLVSLAFVLTALFLLGLRRSARRAGLVDVPGGRKHHNGSIPLIGGVGIFLAFAAVASMLPVGLREYLPLLASMAFLLVVGIIDDLMDIQASMKLVAQIFAAVLVTSWGNIQIETLGNLFGSGPVLLGDWSIPVTVFALVGLINAVNMLDGIDGLAGGFSFIALVVFAATLFGVGEPLGGMVAALLAAAVAGFLVQNLRSPWRRRASVFLGDAGSMVLGLAVGWFAVESVNAGASCLSPMAVLWVLALPVMDTLSLMVRRMARGRSPFYADREHLHHVFKRAGFCDQKSAYALLSLTVVLSLVGVIASCIGLPDGVILGGLLFLGGLHFYFISHAWRILRIIRRRRGLS